MRKSYLNTVENWSVGRDTDNYEVVLSKSEYEQLMTERDALRTENERLLQKLIDMQSFAVDASIDRDKQRALLVQTAVVAETIVKSMKKKEK